MFTEALRSHDEVRGLLAEALRVFEELGDAGGLARTLGLIGQLRFWAGDAAAAIDDLERAAEHAHKAGDGEQESHSLGYVLIASLHGPTPVPQALELCERMAERLPGNRRVEVAALRCRINLEAMAGRFEVSRRLVTQAEAITDDLGLEVTGASVSFEAARAELFAGDPATAEAKLRPGLEILERIGNHGHWVTAAIVLADALLEQRRPAEAEALADQAELWAMQEDIDPQIGRRRIKARVLALRDEFDWAERLAREAVELASGTDYLENEALARADLAEVLELAGRRDEARAELGRALELYEQKGIVVQAERVRARLTG
jgi:tetratricopeptide (TPR) repeat protein